jgi:CheY-like chemotaxis protein
LIRVKLGPLPSACAHVWIDHARTVISMVRAADVPVDTPPEVADAFDAYLDEWQVVADASEEFRWEGEIDPGELRHLATYWFHLANLLFTRAEELGLPNLPPEGDPFYYGLVEVITDALARVEDEAHIGEKLQRSWPGVGEAATEPPALEVVPAEVAPIRVVLVDDNEDIRLLLRFSLERDQGFDIVGEAGDGAEGVDVCAELQPDVVVLDYSMPVMDGLSALPRIRERAPDAAVFLFTAEASDAIRERAESLGARFLPKHTPLEEIAEAVTRAAARRV